MKRLLAAALVTGIVLVGYTQAGGSKLKIGDAAPAFSKLPGVDGKDHSLGDYKKDVLVIAITCNHCPVAVRWGSLSRAIRFLRRSAMRSIASRLAAISMSRSITAVASGRPAPRNGAVGAVLVITPRRRTQAIGTS